MKLIYKARDITEAHIISGLLKANGIETHVGGHYLQGGIGDLAAIDFATINVADENVDHVVSIISEYDKNNIQTDKTKYKNKFILPAPFIVLVLSITLMLLLAILFGD